MSLNKNREESEGCMDHPESPIKSDYRSIPSEKNKYPNNSTQQPSPCAKDQPESLPSDQVTGSSSPRSLTDDTPDIVETSEGSQRQNDSEDLNKTLEMTMKSSQTIPVLEQQKDACGKGSHNDKHGKRIKHCPNQEQIKSQGSPNTNTSAGSTNNPQVHPTSAKPSVNRSPSLIKVDKNSRKQKTRHLHSNKTAKTTNENNQSPVVCTRVLPSSSQSDTSKTVGQLPKSKQSKNVTISSEVSSLNKTQVRKRGRPKLNKLQLAFTNSPNNENPAGPNPDFDAKQSWSTVPRKRGRPKRCSSVQPQSSQTATVSKKQDAGDQPATSEVRDMQQKCSRSNRVIMKTIIRKINKMKVKRRDQVLTQILLGQKQCDIPEFPQESSGVEACRPVPPATHSLSTLVTSFGGKLGPQINVSKRGTIYMGKRRGRKPKYDRNSEQVTSPNSQQLSVDTTQFNTILSTMHQSLESQTCCSGSKNNGSSLSIGRSSQLNSGTQKIKAPFFIQLDKLQNSKSRCEKTLFSGSGVGVNGHSTLDRTDRETNGRFARSVGFPSTRTTGSVLTMSGVQGNNSLKGKAKPPYSFPSEHLSSPCLPLSSGQRHDSNGTCIANCPLSFSEQEAQKFKCHRRSHHCLGLDKLRRHKYKCKKKYLQLRAKRQDPDFLAEVEDLVVRLREIHIVHHITRARLDDDGSGVGKKSAKGKSQSHDLQCRQEGVHRPAMFQINFSGYYSPHSTLPCDPLHYVRMANMRRKHACPSEPSEQIVTHFPVMHKLGYPVSGGGFFHPSYKVPFTTTSLGFGLYRGYPSAAPLYPSSFPSSFVHHYSKNPIISPSKFHKKKSKVSKQDSGGLWGGKSLGSYPKTTPTFSCDCFSRQSWQREKPREKGGDGRDEHGRMREREQDIDWLLWQNKLSKDNVNLRGRPSSFSVFSSTQNKDKTFPSNLRQMGERRLSEHQPPWRCMRGFESKLGNRSANQDQDNEDTLEGPESDRESTAPLKSSRRAHSLLKQPTLFSNTQRQRRIRKGNGVTSASTVLMEQDVPDFSSLGDKRAGKMFIKKS